MNKFHKLLSTLALSFAALTPLASPADAISFTLNLNWEGISESDGTTRYFLTNSFFTADDLNGDGFIRATDSDFSEVIDFAVTFTKDPNMNLVVYNFGDITSNPAFTFNYDIDNNIILQDGVDPVDDVLTGLYIGNRNSISGFSLDSFEVGIQGILRLTDAGGINNARSDDNSTPKIGTLITASEPAPVPFEFEASGGILMLGAAWFLRKKLQKKAVND